MEMAREHERPGGIGAVNRVMPALDPREHGRRLTDEKPHSE